MSNYDLELEKVAEKIISNRAKIACLQFPDGLKRQATEIAEQLEKNTGAICLIWLGSCYGACDTPTSIQNLFPKVDMLVQFGHSAWQKS